MAFYQASNNASVTNPSAEKETDIVYSFVNDEQPLWSALYNGTEPPSYVAVQPERTTQRVDARQIKQRKMNRTALVTIPLVVTALLVTILGVQIWGNRRLGRIMADMPDGRASINEKSSSDAMQDQVEATSKSVTVVPCHVRDPIDAGAECVVKAGTDHGNPFDDYSIYMNNGKITALEVKIGWRRNKLTGLRTRYGNTFTGWRGENSGRTERFTLRTNETITSLRMFVGDYRPFVGVIGLGIETSQARNVFYGTNDTDIISVTTGTWNEVVYFSGKSGLVIDYLVIHSLECNSFDSNVILRGIP